MKHIKTYKLFESNAYHQGFHMKKLELQIEKAIKEYKNDLVYDMDPNDYRFFDYVDKIYFLEQNQELFDNEYDINLIPDYELQQEIESSDHGTLGDVSGFNALDEEEQEEYDDVIDYIENNDLWDYERFGEELGLNGNFLDLWFEEWKNNISNETIEEYTGEIWFNGKIDVNVFNSYFNAEWFETDEYYKELILNKELIVDVEEEFSKWKRELRAKEFNL